MAPRPVFIISIDFDHLPTLERMALTYAVTSGMLTVIGHRCNQINVPEIDDKTMPGNITCSHLPGEQLGLLGQINGTKYIKKDYLYKKLQMVFSCISMGLVTKIKESYQS